MQVESAQGEKFKGALSPQQAALEAFARLRDSPEEPGLAEKTALELEDILAPAHPADLADLLESLPPEERAMAWGALAPEVRGPALLEAGDEAREALMETVPEEALAAAFADMPGDDVAALLRDLSAEARARMIRLSGMADNPELRASLAFDDDTVGGRMDFQPLLAREGDTVAAMREHLRGLGELPSHCDKLFVVDRRARLSGVLPLKRLLLNAPEARAGEIMVSENLRTFRPADSVEHAAGAFERYDLISAPVLDGTGKIVGRVTIDEILDHIHANRERRLLSSAGVDDEEDLFAPLGRRFANRWRWLFVNMRAAFAISRVIGLFEASIASLVALASLMPIVASMSGGVGNQTATLTVRAIALGQINAMNWGRVLRGEASLALGNGLLWGGMVGGFGYALYGRLDLALVLLFSMTACFLAAAVSGFGVPMLMRRLGQDPALGATVVLTAAVDMLAFLVFLGLGALFLV